MLKYPAVVLALALSLWTAIGAHAGSSAFLVGVNYPWYQEGGHHYYGQSFGGLTEERKRTIEGHLDDIASTGVRAIRLWTFCAGGDWLDYVHPLPRYWIDDTRWFVRAAHQRGIGVLPSIWDFYLNRNHREAIADASKYAKLTELYVEPLVKALNGEPGLIGWDICNEPEWMVRWAPWGDKRPPGVPEDRKWPDVGPGHHLSVIKAWLKPQIEAIHRAGGRVTLGAVSPYTVRLWKGLGLDEYHAHFYPPDATAFLGDLQYHVIPPVARLGLDRPCTLGEFAPNGRNTHLGEILGLLRDRGYAGAWAWDYFGDGYPENMAHPFSFRARRAEFRAFTQGR